MPMDWKKLVDTIWNPFTGKTSSTACMPCTARATKTASVVNIRTMNSGVNLPMVEFLEAADGRIPNLAGIKFNHHNLYEYQNCLRACGGKFDVIYGVDEFFAGALAVGAECFIGSTYNYSAELYTAVWRAFEAGDRAAVLDGMRKICQGVDLLNRHGGLAAGKAMMLVKGIDCGNPRLPFLPLPEEERSRIAAALRAVLAS